MPDARLRRALKLIVVASLMMGVAVWGTATALQEWFVAPSVVLRAGGLGLLVASGLAVLWRRNPAFRGRRSASVARPAAAQTVAIIR